MTKCVVELIHTRAIEETTLSDVTGAVWRENPGFMHVLCGSMLHLIFQAVSPKGAKTKNAAAVVIEHEPMK